MRVLIAPDKFRGTLSAMHAGGAIAAGWRRVRQDDEVDVASIADGGEGTLDALLDALGGRREVVRVAGPLGDPVDAAVGMLDGEAEPTAVVESAQASGLALISPARRDPRRASSRGTGDLVRAALDLGAVRILVCLGGSASTDGGAGLASALGVRFLDANGQPVGDGGAALARLARIDLGGVDPRVAAARIEGAIDVDNPLTGPSGSAAVFGPQKGATPETVGELDAALGHLAAVCHRDLGVSPREEPGAGAAGGLGFGLLAFCGARLRRGFDVVADALDLRTRVERADLVVTGEGAFDAQTARGKAAGGMLDLAAAAGRAAAVVCGVARAGAPAAAAVVSLVELVGPERARDDARRAATEAGAALAELAEDLVGERRS